jgi:polyhydroxyalkanoate synthase
MITVPEPVDALPITDPLYFVSSGVAPHPPASQHGPRPLPLFLELLRSETAASPERRQAALAGLAAYQRAARKDDRPTRPIVDRQGRATLRGFGGTGPTVIFVPSLINPPHVLDLAPGNSLLEWLATVGVRPLLVDWGEPDADARDLSIAGHVEQLLLPLIDRCSAPPILVGYCLGGTMATAAAALRPLAGLALLATPWRFSAFPDETRTQLAKLWADVSPLAEAFGLMPMEALQAGFWRMDTAKTIAKFERFGTLDPGGPEAAAFVALEDWANAGPPLTLAAARDLLVNMFHDDLPGTGRWRVGGRAVDPASLRLPILDIASERDLIVPAASALAMGDRRLLAQGHVGMIVGSKARATLWEPLAAWLSETARA